MKKKTLLAGIYTAIIYAIVIFAMVSCGRPTPQKQATTVINHSDKDIIIETLHQGGFSDGVYKLSIDTNDYIVVVTHYDAVAITKHN